MHKLTYRWHDVYNFVHVTHTHSLAHFAILLARFVHFSSLWCCAQCTMRMRSTLFKIIIREKFTASFFVFVHLVCIQMLAIQPDIWSKVIANCNALRVLLINNLKTKCASKCTATIAQEFSGRFSRA